MNAKQLMEAIGEVDGDLILAASPDARKKRRSLAPWAATAVTACLLLALGSGIIPLLTGGNASDGRPIIVPGGTETKQSILSLPGAALPMPDGPPQNPPPTSNVPGDGVVSPDGDGNILLPEEYCEVIKKNFIPLVGDAANILTVEVPSGEYLYRITSFDLTVRDSLGREVGDTPLRCITVRQCLKDGGEAEDGGGMDVAKAIGKSKGGLFIAADASERSLTIEGVTFPLSDYADLVVVSKWESDGETFAYDYEKIPLNDLRT